MTDLALPDGYADLSGALYFLLKQRVVLCKIH
jgi:hypothetical protein